MAKRRSFGRVRQLPSGRWQAFYGDPDGRVTTSRTGRPTPVRHNAPTTFESKKLAMMWLDEERKIIERTHAGIDEWKPPALRVAEKLAAERSQPMTVAEFLPVSLEGRRVKGRPLQERTLVESKALMRRHILPTFGDIAICDVTREMVERWWKTVADGKQTTRRHAYSALHALFADAVDRGLIATNPVRIRGASSTVSRRELTIPSAEQIRVLVEATDVNRRLMIMLGAFCGLRFGEVTALRRRDIDLDNGVIRVRAAIAEVPGKGLLRKETKSGQSRDVPIPSGLAKRIKAHLLAETQPGPDGLLFAAKGGGYLPQSSFRGNAEIVDEDGNVVKRGRGFTHARKVAGLEESRFHDLRQACGTWYTQQGASQAEVMSILGHTTPNAALIYQHYTDVRGRELAERLSDLAGGNW